MDYLLVKLIHIISATILFGTGIGSAFYMFMANRKKDIKAMAFVVKTVVIADWIFTSPAVIIQLLSGLYMVHLAGYDLSWAWLKWGLILYFFAGICWLPVVYFQIRMEKMLDKAIKENAPIPDLYWRFDFWWILLGSLAFPAVMVIFYLMVMKPN